MSPGGEGRERDNLNINLFIFVWIFYYNILQDRSRVNNILYGFIF